MVRSLGIRYSQIQTSLRQAHGDRHQEAPRTKAGPEVHRQDVAPGARHIPEDKEEERAGGLLQVRPQLHRRHLPPGEAQAHEERLASFPLTTSLVNSRSASEAIYFALLESDS